MSVGLVQGLLHVAAVLPLISSCPVWFYDNSSHCLCSDDVEGYISCSQKDLISYLYIGKALGFKNDKGALVAHIPYIYPKKLVDDRHLYINLTGNIFEERRRLCGKLHRDSNGSNFTYCGHCTGDYGPAIYSFGIQCAKCDRSTGSLKYFALQLFPISVFYAAVLIFRVDLTRPTMFHYVIFCNSITFMFRYSAGLVMSYLYSRGDLLEFTMKLALSLSGVWTLDFLRFVVPPFCIDKNMHDCAVPFFDFFPVVYLLAVTAIISLLIKLHRCRVKLILCLWRPFQRILEHFKLNRNPTEAVTHTYATFFALYLFKTVSVALITALTSPAISQDKSKTERLTVYYDPTAKSFDPHHITIIMISFTTAAVLILPALMLLIFFRTAGVQRFYHMQLGRQCQVVLRIFVTTLENGYKDGSNGTKDLRPLSGVVFTIAVGVPVVVVALLRIFSYTDNLPWPFSVFGFAILAVVYGVVRPYKKKSNNNMAVFMYGVLVVISNLICFIQQRSQGSFHKQRKFMLGLVVSLILTVNIIYTVYIAHKVFQYFGVYEKVKNLTRNICWLCRCPCWKLMRNGEEERLLSNQGLPAYYQ